MAADPKQSGSAVMPSQMLVGFMTNEEWDALLVQVNGLIEEAEALPPGEHKTQVFALLDGIDAIHREAMRRLVRLFKEGVLGQVISDPAIHTLMELYDLMPAEQSEASPKKYATIPIKVARAAPSAPVRYPHWVPVLKARDDLASGTVQKFDVDNYTVLLCRRDDQFFAVESRCALDGRSLHGATINGFTLTCPNHPGCHYDMRQGTRLGGPVEAKIACYPVKVEEDGRVLVGLDMNYKPSLPSF